MGKKDKNMTLHRDDYALVVKLDQDKLGRSTGDSVFSLSYNSDNKWDQNTHDGVVDMLTILCEVVRMMDTDSEFRKTLHYYLDKHAPKVPDLKVVDKEDNIIRVDWSNKDER